MDRVSPRLFLAASQTRSEAQVRALAAAKVEASRAYQALVYATTDALTAEELVDQEIDLAKARKALFAADAALAGAV